MGPTQEAERELRSEEPGSPRDGEGVVCGEQKCKGVEGRQVKQSNVTGSHSAKSKAGRLSGHCPLKDKCKGLRRRLSSECLLCEHGGLSLGPQHPL